MQINLPHKVRATLYILTVLTSPVVGYLSVTGSISKELVALWSAEVAAISLLAAFNVKK